MDFQKYYEKHKTYITYRDSRLQKIIQLILRENPKNLLDIGCGSGFLLAEINKKNDKIDLHGVDVYKIKAKYFKYKKHDITKGLPFENNKFSCIVLGEVIEHVPDPDFLLKEIRRCLKKNGTLIISTPNLVSWANRILVLLGIQPLYTETSSVVNLGRKFKILGQGRGVQGHLKIFTSDSLKEILMKEKFNVVKKHGVPFFFPFPVSLIDRAFNNVVSLSSGLLFVARKN